MRKEIQNNPGGDAKFLAQEEDVRELVEAFAIGNRINSSIPPRSRIPRTSSWLNTPTVSVPNRDDLRWCGQLRVRRATAPTTAT